MGLFARKTGPDRFPLPRSHAYAAEHELISELLEAHVQKGWSSWQTELKQTVPGRAIAAMDPEGVRRIAVALLERSRHLKGANRERLAYDHPIRRSFDVTTDVLDLLLRRAIPFTADEIEALLQWRAGRGGKRWHEPIPLGALSACERFAKKHALTPGIQTALESLFSSLSKTLSEENLAKPRQRIDALFGREASLPVLPGEAWTDRALADLANLDKASAWTQLFLHALTAKASKPAKRWSKTAREHLDAVGEVAYAEHIATWLELLVAEWSPARNETLLRGLIWYCGFLQDPPASVARRLADVAIGGYQDDRAVKVANAALWALGQLPGMDGVAQLAIVKARVRHRGAKKTVDKALVAAAHARGLAPDEIEELGIPTFGLTEPGRMETPLGEVTAVVEVQSTSNVKLAWRTADGKPRKTVPVSVKRDHADELKALRARVKDIQKMLGAQRDRIDRLFLSQRRWPIDVWRERYFDHPLVGAIARRLLWTFHRDGATWTGIGLGNDIVNVEDEPLDVSGDAEVALWHPIEAETDDVLAWRSWLESHEITQPIKQAHREIYLLTEAERTTRLYSNRFAAHVIRQHQFNALCGARGWTNQLRLMVDAEVVAPHRSLAAWDLRAEFWVDPVGDHYTVDTNELGSYYFLATDQVRFHAADSAVHRSHTMGGGYAADTPSDPVPLDQVPALVLSEVFRDVDLFVGVASVGNDPTWHDGGPEGRHLDYWTSFSFGELNATAKTRRDVMTRLLPKLKIADRCHLDGRFLVVRGDIRTYRIHLGSGNIQMEPNNEYLCIVAGTRRTKGPDLFLPFEGDRTFSIILSKAFMLAADKKIKDETILAQIR